MSEPYREAKECLDKATAAVTALKRGRTSKDVQLALVTILDVCAELARLLGVPNAVEPETGTPVVETAVAGTVSLAPAAPPDEPDPAA